jgi:hypothetical protein
VTPVEAPVVTRGEAPVVTGGVGEVSE